MISNLIKFLAWWQLFFAKSCQFLCIDFSAFKNDIFHNTVIYNVNTLNFLIEAMLEGECHGVARICGISVRMLPNATKKLNSRNLTPFFKKVFKVYSAKLKLTEEGRITIEPKKIWLSADLLKCVETITWLDYASWAVFGCSCLM